MKNLKYHPACLLFPRLGKAELEELAADIKANGQRNPIILYQGKILDGRNRLAACKIAKVKPMYVQWKGTGSPLQWVISENLIRRHLTSSQRAVIALDVLPLLEKEAKERQRLRTKKVAKKQATISENGKATQFAARLAKTNNTYVEQVKSVNKNAPEILDKVRAGVIKVPDAVRLSRLPKDERQELLKHCNGHSLDSSELHDLLDGIRKERRKKAAYSFARKSAGKCDIFIGDMSTLEKRLNNNSADLFLTDPPYAEVEQYERLAKLAAEKLKPGKLCLAYTGQFYLPEILKAMSKHLKYWWMFAIRFSGSHCAIHPRHIQNSWKPILVYGKPPLKPSSEWLSDILSGGGRDKKHHDWGQDQTEVEYLIDKLTEPGDLIVDPFCGGGQIPAAAKSMGRRWVATEIDKATALISRKRLSEA
jgi:hypothetical protein